MLTTASEHYLRQQEYTTTAVVAAREAERDPGELARRIATLQVLAAQDAIDSIDPILAEQGITAAPVAGVAVAQLAGIASDGRPLATLFEQASNLAALTLMAVTQVQDAARNGSGMSIAARSDVGYVRMLNPPSCRDCVILAGKYYRWNAGFERHPKCDCRHIPSRENIAGDLTTDPRAYYDSLDVDDRIDLAGSVANYRAIEDGADLSQIINAYRRSGRPKTSLATGGVIERIDGLKFTTVGGSDRSWAYQQQVGLGLIPANRTAGNFRRLMPETIYQLAHSREDALRMLKANGWIFDLDARAAGRAALDATRRIERGERRRSRRAQRAADLLDAAAAPDFAELQQVARAIRARRRNP